MPGRRAVTVAAVSAAGVAAAALAATGAAVTAPAWPAPLLALAVAGLVAETARLRRRHANAARDRARLLEQERMAAGRAAVDGERARLARDLHDVVAHTVSVMVVQAGAARQVVRGAPDAARQALLAVESSGRDAMSELRHMLNLLAPRTDGGPETGPAGDELTPAPGLSRLDALVDRVAFAGLPVEVRIDGSVRPLPAGIDVTAYRIVQEALTNTLKHAGGGRAEVALRYGDRYLRVEVLNTGPSVLRGTAPPTVTGVGPASGRATSGSREGGGRGLIGLRERVALYGGDLDARRRLGGGFRVRARLPLDPP